MFSPGIPGTRPDRALGQAQRDSLQPGEDMDTPGCFHQATGGSSLTPSPSLRSYVYTHDPAPAHHSAASAASIPSAHLEAVEITPPEPVTLFNDMSGQNVTSLCEKAWGRGAALSLKPGLGVCSHSSEHVCVFVPPHVSERTLSC